MQNLNTLADAHNSRYLSVTNTLKESMNMQNLNNLAEDLTSAGVKYKIVTAAESKDTGAPYTHKRYLKSLDGTRFMYVAVAINQLDNEFIELVGFGRDAKEMSTKERSTWITKALHRLGKLGEVFERIDNIGILTLSLYSGDIYNAAYKMSRFADSQWDGNVGVWLNVIKGLTSARNNVVKDIRSIQKEAKERGITNHKIEALAETCKLSSTGYSMKRAS